MNTKVSVIIPVYNAEPFIAQCIESLLKQKLEQCEFIFINDGSTDGSRQIIENYQKYDNRIIIINQVNQGVSNSRNNGLKMAKGEYVGFVDADDFIETGMYEELYYSAKQGNCDMVISNFYSEIDGHKVHTNYPFPSNISLKRDFIAADLLPYFIKEDNLNTVCNKVYKNKMVKENKIVFPENLVLGEDGMFNITFISQATTVKYIDYTGYLYREVKGSATRNIVDKDYFQRALDVFKLELPENLFGNIDREKVKQLKSIKLMRNVMAYIHMYFEPTKKVKFKKRYKYVRNMLSNEVVRDSLPIFYEGNYNLLNNYEKVLISMMKTKFTAGLYILTTYSRIRNK